ncbi:MULTISPECIES: hypothetical protein [Streptomyces]|nr:hypothetical protein [Streptomyces sp. st170]WSU85569.1 hypothetical protein OG215_35620 [Streptomyces globisporus]
MGAAEVGGLPVEDFCAVPVGALAHLPQPHQGVGAAEVSGLAG